MAADPALPPGELRAAAAFVRQRCGVDLDDTKGYLVAGRWQELLRESGCATVGDLCRRAAGDADLADRLIDAICTKETSFFRDSHPFELLTRSLVPDQLARLTAAGGSGRRLRLWCAACSTGQEVYSLAMALDRSPQLDSSWATTVLASDLSATALERARAGRYTQFEADRGLSAELRQRYFTAASDGWTVIPRLRQGLRFARLNLLDLPAGLGDFDIIFCRNVATYFGPDDRGRLFEGLADHLVPGGALVVGATESLVGVTSRLDLCRQGRSSYYRRVAGAAGEGEDGAGRAGFGRMRR